jgi:uncharacterized protein YbbC (DUF1343 family)
LTARLGFRPLAAMPTLPHLRRAVPLRNTARRFLRPLLAASAVLVPSAHVAAQVTLGIDVLLSERIELVRGKRLALVTNQAGVDGALVPTVDRLARDERFELVQLYSPEHGLRGDAPAGESVDDAVDARTGVPVQSLYGARRRPTPESLARADLVLFDLQDVGARPYTYMATLGELLQAAAEAKKGVVVLDRPDPLGGTFCEGAVREERFKSFISWGAIPLAHGMTAGELARLFRTELALDVALEVVPMRGWKRSMVWEDTGLAWVPTSPHMPHALTAHLYLATGLIGGTTRNLCEGVGTTLPFELVAAEFADAEALTTALAAERLPGLRVRAIHITPRYGKFEKKLLHGVQLVPSDLAAIRPVHTALAVLCAFERLHPGKIEFEDERAQGIHWGTLGVAEAVRAKKSPAEIEAAWKPGLDEFARRRAAALLYE